MNMLFSISLISENNNKKNKACFILLYTTRECGSTVGAARSGGIVLILRELTNREGSLTGVTKT